jgi:calcineurin-like phosphoesterase family protein
MQKQATCRLWAISDIHGCAHTFRRLLWDIIQFNRDDHLYLLGDYINKGPDSKQVLKTIRRLKKTGFNVTMLRGNHEDILLTALKHPHYFPFFIKNGGRATLKSFGVKNLDEIPEKYIDMLESTQYYAETEKYLLVHAGFNFKKKNIFKDEKAMMWIRNFKNDPEKTNNKTIVHGHSPQSKNQIKKQLTDHKKPPEINIDGGCVYAPRIGARLCALEMNTLTLHFSRNIDV